MLSIDLFVDWLINYLIYILTCKISRYEKMIFIKNVKPWKSESGEKKPWRPDINSKTKLLNPNKRDRAAISTPPAYAPIYLSVNRRSPIAH